MTRDYADKEEGEDEPKISPSITHSLTVILLLPLLLRDTVWVTAIQKKGWNRIKSGDATIEINSQ